MTITKHPNGYGFSLEQAEVGDKLMVSSGGWDAAYTPVTITRVTKTRISTSDGNDWMIASHRRVGASEWSKTRLRAFDQAAINEANEQQRQRQLANRLSDQRWRDLPLETLERVAAICDEKAKP